MIKEIDFEKLKAKKIKITLSNGFVYHGTLMSYGKDFLTISHNAGITYVSIPQICSLEEE